VRTYSVAMIRAHRYMQHSMRWIASRAVTRDVQEQEQTIHARTATAHSRIRLHECIYLEEFAGRRNGVVLAFSLLTATLL
jgi:hypothetical protein